MIKQNEFVFLDSDNQIKNLFQGRKSLSFMMQIILAIFYSLLSNKGNLFSILIDVIFHFPKIIFGEIGYTPEQ